VSISSDDDSHTTEESDGKYESEHDSDVDMCMVDDVDTLCGIDLDGNLDMAWDGDDEEKEDEEEKDEEEEDKDEEEAEDEDDDKEPRTIGLGEMVNTLADDVDTMVEDQPIVLPEQTQDKREYTPRPQPLWHAPLPQTLEPRPLPWTPEMCPLSRLVFFIAGTLHKPSPVVPTLREAEAARNTSDVDVDQQQLSN